MEEEEKEKEKAIVRSAPDGSDKYPSWSVVSMLNIHEKILSQTFEMRIKVEPPPKWNIPIDL